VIENLPEQNHPELLIGLNQADDSGVMRLDEKTGMIFTVDFFPAIVDDPFVFGQVAAANAMSDVYAMGGRPLCALNIVTVPQKGLPLEAVGEMLRGGIEKVNEGGAVVVGGHTIKGGELKYGLSVAGLVSVDGIVRAAGALVGDRLVLTKPLGTGIYSTALKMDKLSPEQERLFYDVMVRLNSTASIEMVKFGANACTDVTGFGLVGHALEVAHSSHVTIALDAGSVPMLPGVLGYASDGYLTGGGMSNLDYASGKVRVEGDLSKELELLIYDPQTSGGLLVSVPGSRAGDYVSSLKDKGVADAVIVGEVIEKDVENVLIRA